jgi:cysteine-S-conjugate beta-lyase
MDGPGTGRVRRGRRGDGLRRRPGNLDPLAGLSADAKFGYLPSPLADELAAACAQFQRTRYSLEVGAAQVLHVPDVIRAPQIAITHFSAAGSPIRPAHARVHAVPRRARLSRPRDHPGAATPASSRLTSTRSTMRSAAVGICSSSAIRTTRSGGCSRRTRWRSWPPSSTPAAAGVFADEIHGPLVYSGSRHIPYASTSCAAAAHTLTATSASKAWNLPGLKCAQGILSNETDRRRWDELAFFATHGASNPGVVANIAAFRHGEGWLDQIISYLDNSRHLLADLLSRHLPRYASALPMAPISPGSTAPRWTCRGRPANSSPNAHTSLS